MHDDLKIDFHKFVDKKLAENNFRILPISKNLMNARLNDIMGFVNNIRRECTQRGGGKGIVVVCM